jgi:uncharacterized protein (PEP-CTERM system associated)
MLPRSTQKNSHPVDEAVAHERLFARNILFVIAAVGTATFSAFSRAQAIQPEAPRATAVAPITAWRFTPEISVTETYTDNAALVPAATAKNSWITESTPGIRIEKTGVRSRLYLDFRLRDFRYGSNSQLNNSQRLLTSRATIEAIDNFLFVDANANITQENRSAFSIAGSTNATGRNGNRVETATNQISPYLRGRFTDLAAYQLRFVAADIRANDATLPDTKGRQWTGFIKNGRVISGLGWSVEGNALSFRSDAFGKLYDERVRATLSYEFDPQIHGSVIAGREATNFAGVQNDRQTTSGLGLEWSPGTRTQLAAVREKRYFGHSQSVSLKHRTALTAWSVTNSRDVIAPAGQLTGAGQGSTASLLSDLLAASIPDPVAREAAVRQRLESSGLSANPVSSGGFATARPFLVRRYDVSVALTGIHNTVTLSFGRNDQSGLGPINVSGADSFSLSNDIRQRGANLNWSYKLSPRSSLSVVATSLKTEGVSTTGLDSNQRSVNLLFSTRIGTNTYASFGARRVHFDNSLDTGYWENAVLGSVSLRY